MVKKLFPSYKLSKLDYFVGGTFLIFCSVLFFHEDILVVGLDSLGYLFGSPFDFYDNCKKINVGFQNILVPPSYPPTLFAISALWLYPFKLFGLLTSPDNLPFYLAYWLKTLTTIVYAASGVVFYKITQIYSDDKDWGKYATAIWLTTPLAIFSQFIFSQCDIIYVFLTLVGFLMFLRTNLLAATMFFGVAMTFKYFPVFIFIPLLLLFEKSIPRILIFLFMFLVPTLLIQCLYNQSPAFIEGSRNFYIIDRIYAAAINIGGGWRIYYPFASFTILCGVTYLSEINKERLPRVAAYVFLVGAILPFLFVLWHPHWLMLCAPAIALTTVLDKRCEKFLILDLVGMLFFIATVSVFFQNNVDVAMFRGGWLLDLDFENIYKMAGFFDFFKEHSAYVFLSAFWGYLVVQIALKFKSAMQENYILEKSSINYGNVRYRFYVGILIFIVPAFLAIYGNYINKDRFTINEAMQAQGWRHYGELIKKRVFEQPFVAKTDSLEEVELLLTTVARKKSGTILLEIVDPTDKTLAKTWQPIEPIGGNFWQKFKFKSVRVAKGGRYKLRLTSPSGKHGNAITWLASPTNIYPKTNRYSKGNAIVDGVPQNAIFGFMIKFSD
ncbi:MAG: hypothetical protein ACD_21C00014G0003 [uncultured bacterium]|nr:MAG: hypothetical protein ACD_21C00014G0003 [uncultured bacterium]